MADITLFGELRCHKTRFYRDALDARHLEYEIAEVDKDPEAARRLTELAGSADKFPTFQIRGRKLRNPTLPKLDRTLAHAGLYDPGLIHDAQNGRFVRYMAPSDGFVSYVRRNDTMVLTHIEIPRALRGGDVGRALAAEVLDHLLDTPFSIRISCPYLHRVASSRAEWRSRFDIGART